MTGWITVPGWTVAHLRRPDTTRTYCGHLLHQRPVSGASESMRCCTTCGRALKGTRRHG